MKTIEANLKDTNNRQNQIIKFSVNNKTFSLFEQLKTNLDIYYFGENVIMYVVNDKKEDILSYVFPLRLLPYGYKEAFKYITQELKDYKIELKNSSSDKGESSLASSISS